MRRPAIYDPEPPFTHQYPRIIHTRFFLHLVLLRSRTQDLLPQMSPSPAEPDCRMDLAHGQFLQPEDGEGEVFVSTEDVS
jgi:hypothetical protein